MHACTALSKYEDTEVKKFNCAKYPEEVQLIVICYKLYFSLTFYKFAKDNEFSTEQTSAWFSVIKSVHEMTVGKFTILFCCISTFSFEYFELVAVTIVKFITMKKVDFFQYIVINIKVISLLLIMSCSNTITKHKMQCFIWYYSDTTKHWLWGGWISGETLSGVFWCSCSSEQ